MNEVVLIETLEDLIKYFGEPELTLTQERIKIIIEELNKDLL